MRICQIVASSGEGGLEKHVEELCNELSKEEDVTLIAPPEMAKKIVPSVNFIPLNFNRSRNNPLLYCDLLRILRKEKFDIVHAQANKAVCLVSRLRCFISAKTIGTIHNTRKNKSRIFRNIDHVIAVSIEAQQLIGNRLPTTVVYNGIPWEKKTSSFSKQKLMSDLGFSDDQPLICSVGRLVDAKGFELLIEAMKNVDAYLVIIGEGKLRSSLQKKIEQLGLPDRVKLLGHRDDVISILKGVDGLVISSKNEGFSYVFAEALLSNLPVLSTGVAAPKEFLPASLIMSKNAHSISEKMNEFIFSPTKWLAQMEPVFAKAKKDFTLEAMAKNTLSVYQSVLKNNS